MEYIPYVDALMDEYLLFRGYVKTYESFSSERQRDRVKNPEVTVLLEAIIAHIRDMDIDALMALWDSLKRRFLVHLGISGDTSRMNQNQQEWSESVFVMETSLQRAYLVRCSKRGEMKRIHSFFEKASTKISNDPSWMPWFRLPYVSNPKDDDYFATFFDPRWGQKVCGMLRSFLTSMRESIPVPRLLALDVIEEETKTLIREVRTLRAQYGKIQGELAESQAEVKRLQQQQKQQQDASPEVQHSLPQHSQSHPGQDHMPRKSPGAMERKIATRDDKNLVGGSGRVLVTNTVLVDGKHVLIPFARECQVSGDDGPPTPSVQQLWPSSVQDTTAGILGEQKQQENGDTTDVFSNDTSTVEQGTDSGPKTSSDTQEPNGTPESSALALKDEAVCRHASAATQVRVSMDGRRVVSGCTNGTVNIYECSEWLNRLSAFKSGKLTLPTATIAKDRGTMGDGKQGNGDASPSKKNGKGGLLRRTLNALTGRGNKEKEKTVRSGNEDQRRVRDGVRVIERYHSGSEVFCVEFDRLLDRYVFAGGANGNVVMLDSFTGSCQWKVGDADARNTSQAHAQPQKSSGGSSTPQSQNRKVPGAPTPTTPAQSRSHPRRLAVTQKSLLSLATSPVDPLVVLSLGGTGPNCSQIPGALRAYNFQVGKSVCDYHLLSKQPTPGQESVHVYSSVLNHNGNMVVVGASDGTIRIFDVKGSAIMQWEAHAGAVTSIAFSSDETSVLSCSVDGTLSEWSLHKRGVKVREYLVPGAAEAAARRSYQYGYPTFDAQSGRMTALSAYACRPQLCEPNESDRFLFSAPHLSSYGYLYVSGNEMPEQAFPFHSGYVTSSQWFPVGDIVASASVDRTVRLLALE